jgi:phosphoglycerate dehydrogenase-like enzyme
VSTPRIFCPQPLPDRTIARLKEYGEVEVFPFAHREISEGELESAVARSDYLFCVHSTPITAQMIAANPKLRGIGVSGPRADLHDLAAIEASGIPLLSAKRAEPVPDDGWSLNGYGLNPRATSDLMVAHILNLAYRVLEADHFCRSTGYFQEMTMDFMGIGLTGKTASLYGLGRVARHAVRKLKAMDMTVLYTKRTRLSEEEDSLGVEWVADKDELIARGDYICMLANFEESNIKLMGAKEFALMKPTAYFINVARGRLVDEEALIDALERGVIAGAGLEVFWNEPPVVRDAYIPLALRKMDNVVLTPHNGGATFDSRSAQFTAVADAIVEHIVAAGGAPLG